jgi:hypothetical protein
LIRPRGGGAWRVGLRHPSGPTLASISAATPSGNLPDRASRTNRGSVVAWRIFRSGA